ncbi:MAG: hypothetical protein BWY26_00490 [Elusimicrobia bacterium ADurb.Bin231]|nr:MAG: hypothetical protein BWY26_00490 [Elusimicrobia bacterium ADurb.Bin231]
MAQNQLRYNRETKAIIRKVATKYGLEKLLKIVENENSLLFEKDVYICLHNIIEAVLSRVDPLSALKEAKNIYNTPIFLVNQKENKYIAKKVPDLDKAVMDLEVFNNCFDLNPYAIVNTLLACIEAQVTGFELYTLYEKGTYHLQNFIKESLTNNSRWDESTLVTEKPVLIIPIGAAGCGKSTFYKELSNVVNISCDNIRYLLFKSFGPCFSPWESCLSWWTVNQLTDKYLRGGYSVFYNGVNTDLEYRSPVTMENPDPLYAGMPYNIKLVYFEPPAKLDEKELKELKSINLWANPIQDMDFSSFSPNVIKIMELIKDNFQRTLARTKDIAEGKKKQDPFDVLYSVPAAIVKLFVEQSFDKPAGDNVIIVPRKDIKDLDERAAFYRSYAEKVQKG